MTLLLAALIGAIVATFVTLIIVYKADSDLHDRIDAMETDLHTSKERINEDLVHLNQRMKDTTP
jgi:hypothetical protein